MALPCFCNKPKPSNNGDIKFCKKCGRVITNYSKEVYKPK